MGPLIPSIPVTQPQSANACPAKRLGPQQRQELALEGLAGAHSVSHLAEEHDVSRQFVYRQIHKAEQALGQAFTPPPPDDERVLFHLPVTKRWLRRFVVALLLICHCP